MDIIEKIISGAYTTKLEKPVQPPFICSCGNERNLGGNFCPECGVDLEKQKCDFVDEVLAKKLAYVNNVKYLIKVFYNDLAKELDIMDHPRRDDLVVMCFKLAKQNGFGLMGVYKYATELVKLMK